MCVIAEKMSRDRSGRMNATRTDEGSRPASRKSISLTQIQMASLCVFIIQLTRPNVFYDEMETIHLSAVDIDFFSTTGT